MSELSEEAYYAGWMRGLEYALWEALIGHRREYGCLDITDDHRTRLRQLSDECDGWVVFDGKNEETWLPLPVWQTRFALWESVHSGDGDGETG